MADNKKTYRINKVATEFNVSWKTIVEHLNQKGFEVEAKITAKLDDAMYQDLHSFYKKDKQAKEESQQLEINIRKDAKTQEIPEIKKPEPPKKEFTEESTVYIKDNSASKPNVPTPVVKTPEVAAPIATPTAPTAKVEVPEVKTPEVKAPEVPKVAEKPKKVEVVKANVVKAPEVKLLEPDSSSSLKVLGTIDLSFNKAPKSRKDKLKPVLKEKVLSKPAVEKKPIVVEKPEPEDKVVETEYKKLEGTKVLGKVEIKTPVKKTRAKKDDEPKKKRKRIRGEKVTADKLRTERNSGRPAAKTGEKPVVSQKDIQDKIKKTLSSMSSGKQTPVHGGKVRKKARKFRRQEHKKKWEEKQLQDIEESKILDVTEFVTANDLANMMDVNVNEIIGACFSLGLMVSINQRLDAETIQIVAEEFDYEVNFVDADETIEIEEEEDREEDLLPRHPIVTVMGHVDHGKTSLLDHIRNANVIAGEAGGITQHVASYEVQLKDDSKMTFIDTPGHEAFTAMRARGAQVTDIAIIVIAADDVVMPQTKEAISHAQAANVPIVFAINKIDKDGANPDRVRESLSAMNILVEEWGGKYQCQEISAKNGINIEELLVKVSLEAELLELKANPNKNC